MGFEDPYAMALKLTQIIACNCMESPIRDMRGMDVDGMDLMIIDW